MPATLPITEPASGGRGSPPPATAQPPARKGPKKAKRDHTRIALDIALTGFGIAAFTTSEMLGLHVASAGIFAALLVWHGWTQRALIKGLWKRARKKRGPTRALFWFLTGGLIVTAALTFVTGFGEIGVGLAAGHEAFANASLGFAGAHVLLAWRRILMLVSGGRWGKRSRSAAGGWRSWAPQVMGG
jgi:hypothetical protein